MDKPEQRKTKYTKKTEVKRDLHSISSRMKKMSVIHLLLLGAAMTYFVVMVYIGNEPLTCDDVHDQINSTLRREKNETDKRLMFHPSVDYEHAINLEHMFDCYMLRKGCGTWIAEYGQNGTNVTINNELVTCRTNDTDLPISEVEEEQCKNMCVPEPFTVLEDVDHIGETAHKPVGIEWYAIIHFWDLIWMSVAVYIQLRLRNLRDNQFSFGPMVIDEKDIAATSFHILSVFITLALYSIDLTMSTLWVNLHRADGSFEMDHGSYWTIYQRNYLLKILHAIYVTILLPILILAFSIREAFQKYELIQFMTEIQ